MAKSTRRPKVPYSEAIADEICDTIAKTHLGLKHFCKANNHWPDERTIYRWLLDHTYFSQHYAQARAVQAEGLVDDIMAIAYDDSHDVYIDDEGRHQCNTAAISRARLKIDSIKWLTSKVLPKKYGDKKDSEENSDNDFISKNRDKL